MLIDLYEIHIWWRLDVDSDMKKIISVPRWQIERFKITQPNERFELLENPESSVVCVMETYNHRHIKTHRVFNQSWNSESEDYCTGKITLRDKQLTFLDHYFVGTEMEIQYCWHYDVEVEEDYDAQREDRCKYCDCLTTSSKTHCSNCGAPL